MHSGGTSFPRPTPSVLPGFTLGGVVGRLLRVPLPQSHGGSGGHREPVAGVAVQPADGEAGHVGGELLQPLLLSSTRVHCAEMGDISAALEDTRVHTAGPVGAPACCGGVGGPNKCLPPLLRRHSSAISVPQRPL